MKLPLAAVCAALLLSACTGEAPAISEPATSVSPSAEPIGSTVPFESVASDGRVTGSGELTLTSVQWVEGPQYVEEYNHTYTPDHQWLVVYVEWSGDFGFNYLNLQWVPDSTGDGVMPPLGMGAFKPLLGEANTDAGNVVWDVPREPGSVMVVDIFGDVFGGWVIE
jgi:hypothetical protein